MLKENIPKFLYEEKYSKELINAIQPEIDKIKLQLSNLLLECCVSTCSEIGIKRFEKDYAIKFNPNLSLSERKKCVINRMLAKKRLTKSELNEFVKRNIDGEQYFISNEAEEYTFKVMLVNENYENSLYEALFSARPSHLVFNIELVNYERRCGTFRANETLI